MKITIKDIAQELNLNFSSVSRALNNKPGVSEETRKLVVDTAKRMGYKPNVIARGLVSSITKTIGVIIPDIQNPVFGDLTTAIIETANESEYDVFLCITNWDHEKEADYIQTVQQKQVDGIIIKSVQDGHSELLVDAQVPVVGFESWSGNNQFSSVSTDNKKGGYIAGLHLIESGYKNTAIVSGPINSTASINRRQGFMKACAENNMNVDTSLIYYGDYNIKGGYQIAKKVLKEHPDVDSFYACNDVMAIGVLQCLEENGIKPGKEIGVIGFDNIKMAGLPQIRLSTVKQPKNSIGRILTKVLLDEIHNKQEDIQNIPQRILLEPELIIRDTTQKH